MRINRCIEIKPYSSSIGYCIIRSVLLYDVDSRKKRGYNLQMGGLRVYQVVY